METIKISSTTTKDKKTNVVFNFTREQYKKLTQGTNYTNLVINGSPENGFKIQACPTGQEGYKIQNKNTSNVYFVSVRSSKLGFPEYKFSSQYVEAEITPYNCIVFKLDSLTEDVMEKGNTVGQPVVTSETDYISTLNDVYEQDSQNESQQFVNIGRKFMKENNISSLYATGPGIKIEINYDL